MSLINKKLSMESIEFQSGIFHSDLTNAVNKLRSKKQYSDENVRAAALDEVIKYHSNMNVQVSVDADIETLCTEVPQIDKNHPLIPNEWKTQKWRDAKTAIDVLGRPLNGSVNRKSGKVSGDFSNFGVTIFIGQNLLDDKNFTDAEISAGLLHEIGHIFTYFEYLGYTLKTNLVLAGVTKAFNESKDIEERKLVLKTAERNLGVEFEDLDRVAEMQNSDAAEIIIVSETAKRMRSELGENLYDYRLFEQLSDEFATRHGGGRDLASLLSKVMRKYGDRGVSNTAEYLVLETMKLSMFVLTLIFIPPTAIGLAVMFYPGGEIYDEPTVRLSKLRNQLIMRLKDKKLPGRLRQDYVADIEAIKVLESELNDRKTFYRYFIETVLPSRRKMRKQIEIQIELEQMASNELFLQASKFKGAANA